MNRGKLIGVIAVIFFIYIAAGPYITVYQIKSAVEKRDGEALSNHIDFPSVRQSLKEQFNVMLIKEMTQDNEIKSNPIAVMGALFTGAIVDKMVDAYITSAGITQLMTGRKPGANTDIKQNSNPPRKVLSNASISYESFDKFVIKAENDTGDEVKFILRRHGIKWMLSEIIIPLK